MQNDSKRADAVHIPSYFNPKGRVFMGVESQVKIHMLQYLFEV